MKALWASVAFALLSTLTTPRAAIAQPADETALNPQAGQVGFTIFAKMLFTLKQEGRFKRFTGQVAYDPARPADTHVDLTIFTASVDMKNPEHAQILKSGDFFDVDRYPTMHFVGAATDVRPDGSMALTGDLTIRDVTRHIAIPVKIAAHQPGAAAGTAPTTTFETTFQIDRTDFGLNGSPKFSGVNVSISKNVQIHIAFGLNPDARPRP